jgi:hypothetical protein
MTCVVCLHFSLCFHRAKPPDRSRDNRGNAKPSSSATCSRGRLTFCCATTDRYLVWSMHQELIQTLQTPVCFTFNLDSVWCDLCNSNWTFCLNQVTRDLDIPAQVSVNNHNATTAAALAVDGWEKVAAQPPLTSILTLTHKDLWTDHGKGMGPTLPLSPPLGPVCREAIPCTGVTLPQSLPPLTIIKDLGPMWATHLTRTLKGTVCTRMGVPQMSRPGDGSVTRVTAVVQ